MKKPETSDRRPRRRRAGAARRAAPRQRAQHEERAAVHRPRDMLPWACRFDLAHVPEGVSERYTDADHELLRECRILVLVMVAAWRWDPGDQLPNGQRVGRELLSALREGPPWPSLDVAMLGLGGPGGLSQRLVRSLFVPPSQRAACRRPRRHRCLRSTNRTSKSHSGSSAFQSNQSLFLSGYKIQIINVQNRTSWETGMPPFGVSMRNALGAHLGPRRHTRAIPVAMPASHVRSESSSLRLPGSTAALVNSPSGKSMVTISSGSSDLKWCWLRGIRTT